MTDATHNPDLAGEPVGDPPRSTLGDLTARFRSAFGLADPVSASAPLHGGDETVEFDPMLGEPVPPAAEPAFPLVRRGYDPDRVDAYVDRLEHELAGLRASSGPDPAVQRELERVGEETASILKLAHEKADALTARAQSEADELRRQAERDAASSRAGAEQRVRQLDADADAIWQERQRLLDDTRSLADRLLSVADEAAERFPGEDTGEPWARRALPQTGANGQTAAMPHVAESV